MTKPPQKVSGFVPVPNPFFDDVLPTLTDSEIRVFLVIVRSTLGWRTRLPTGEVEYKRRAWITNTLFIRRTGRSSTAVSRAVKSLVQHGLIVVETEGGEILTTASERRHIRGRLFYRLSDTWNLCNFSDIANVASNTYKINNIQNKEAALRDGWHRASEVRRVS